MTHPRQFQLFIDGEFVPAASGERFAVISPIDGAEYASVAKAGIEDVNLAAAAAHRAFSGSWPRMLPFDRGRVLQEIANYIRRCSDEIATAERCPFGGKKKSGIGRELGMHALDLYTELKNVIIDISDTTTSE